MRKIHFMIVATLFLKVSLVSADTVFTDGTFNLSNYSTSTFQTGGATINISQNLTAGNPGSALEVVTTVPSPLGQSYGGTTYFLNNTFVYNASTQGAIQSINLSVDQNLTFNGLNPVATAFTPVIVQSGDYYVFHVPISLTQGMYQTVSATDLVSSDFDLVTNMLNEAVDTSMHPDFSSGSLELGFSSGLSSSGISQTIVKDALYDNLSYDLATSGVVTTTTPEPRSILLTFAGLMLVSLAVVFRFNRQNRFI